MSLDHNVTPRAAEPSQALRLRINGYVASKPPSLLMPSKKAEGHNFPASAIEQYSRGPQRNRRAVGEGVGWWDCASGGT
jgi:hypothetical protein